MEISQKYPKMIFTREVAGKIPRPRFRRTVCVKLCNRAHGNVTRATFCENLEENAAPHDCDAQFRLCDGAQSCTWTCHKSHALREFTGKMPRPRSRRTVCASLCSRKAHGHGTRANVHKNLQGKCRGPQSRCTVCASLRSRIAHRHVTRVTLCENL